MNRALREAESGDVAALVALERLCFGEGAWGAGAVTGALRPGPALVWEEEGQLLGYALAAVVLDEAELHRIGVAPTSRGQGIAIALLDALEAAAQTQGAERLFLEVRADNAPAIGLYERQGFEKIGRRPRYYADGVDALLFALVISRQRRRAP
jgi:ribosomal-protein-alanine N-acetyltransferase